MNPQKWHPRQESNVQVSLLEEYNCGHLAALPLQ